jgi:tetratricopeptide (TPR) repeat protein
MGHATEYRRRGTLPAVQNTIPEKVKRCCWIEWLRNAFALVIALAITSTLAVWPSASIPAPALRRVELQCSQRPQRIILSGTLVIVPRATNAAWLEVEEEGADIAVDDPTAEKIEVTVPPRYGRFFVPLHQQREVRIARTEASGFAASVRLVLNCAESGQMPARVAWYRRAGSISMTLLPVAQGIPLDQTLNSIAELEVGVPDSSATALVAHLRAQAWFSANRTTDSIRAFTQAETAWRFAGDRSRALVARVGRAEELNRAGRYVEALAISNASESGTKTDQYFAYRIGFSRCLALKYLGQLRKAATCYAEAVDRQRAAGEQAEASGLLLALADTWRDLGKPSVAEGQALSAYRTAVGPDAPILRGRAQLLLHDLLLDRGIVPEALDRINSALVEFGSVHATRWEANAMLRAAWLYSQVGAIEEARAFVDSALLRLSEQDAPARVAAARLLSAEIDRRGGDIGEGLRSARSAASIYAHLNMATELYGAQTLIAQLELESGDRNGAAAVLSSQRPLVPTPPWRTLVEARIALADDKLEYARKLVASLSVDEHSLPEAVDLAVLAARLDSFAGKRDRALLMLRKTSDSIRAKAQSTSSALLADLILRQGIPLRTLAMSLISKQSAIGRSGSEQPAEAWEWLQRTLPSGYASSPNRNNLADDDRFNEAVATELLSDPTRVFRRSNVKAARGLLAAMASQDISPRDAAHQSPLQTLEEFRSALPEDSTFLAYLDAETVGVTLWVSNAGAWVSTAPEARKLRALKGRLLDLVATPGATVADIRFAARALSTALLFGAPTAVQPKVLLVDANGELGDIPWSILQWPGSENDLIEDTTTSLAQLHAPCCVAAPGRSARGYVFTASTQRATGALSYLPTANIESDLISSSAVSGVTFSRVVPDSRDVVLDALSQTGDWIHFATHGETVPDRIGYSGVWLGGTATREPFFLNGIDALNNRIASQVVVIGTCQSAERARDGVHSAFSFADAVSRAGAHNVVAALWPISDSAAAIWIPEFYRNAASGRPDQIADSLRKAQLRLRESRNFRHPYYWSSLVHLRLLDPKKDFERCHGASSNTACM